MFEKILPKDNVGERQGGGPSLDGSTGSALSSGQDLYKLKKILYISSE